nr:immunoglobulin heavy chain junction region [Macaca mulatta]MOY19395.1 immunoglobulin heavy chain junction region [Macaca mulatta]MOY20061.1 immunoglobulin heavy chain junction region [Macaca mulatta]MOY20868.1 immunoglobulin heavy chain junction region [Macaca mulatta]
CARAVGWLLHYFDFW